MSQADVPSATLYREAVALAIGTIVYTTGSAAAAVFTHILYRLNGKQVIFTIAHEIVNLVLWPTLQMQEYKANLRDWRNPNANIAYDTSPNVLVKVLFAIRSYFFNVESLLFFFWSLMLFVSVWEIQSRMLKCDRFIAGSKWISFLLPAVQAILSNLPQWRPYDHSHHPSPSQPRPKTAHSTTSSTSTATTSDNEDRFILVRFVAGFLVIGSMQTAFLLAQYYYAKDMIKRRSPFAEEPHLGMTAKQQLVDWAYFLASGSTGYLILIAFGTTRESRRQVRRIAAKIRTFLCGRREKDEEWVSFRAGSESPGGDGGFAGNGSGGGGMIVIVTVVIRMGAMGGERRRALPPRPMTFVSRDTPLGSPGESAARESPAGFSVVDLRTPARSTHREEHV
ncbi:unnamed protein product [Tuber aestivum]|uniref:Uncharacterized protein n=1 Tax=Tuber aestivum TaxID=59557 RepID=A0A292PR40_9PEZI|nr:unnamed protein product [Tuber aestivum]